MALTIVSSDVAKRCSWALAGSGNKPAAIAAAGSNIARRVIMRRFAIEDDRHQAYTEKLGDHWQITLLQKVVSVWVLVGIVALLFRAGVLSVEARDFIQDSLMELGIAQQN